MATRPPRPHVNTHKRFTDECAAPILRGTEDRAGRPFSGSCLSPVLTQMYCGEMAAQIGQVKKKTKKRSPEDKPLQRRKKKYTNIKGVEKKKKIPKRAATHATLCSLISEPLRDTRRPKLGRR